MGVYGVLFNVECVKLQAATLEPCLATQQILMLDASKVDEMLPKDCIFNRNYGYIKRYTLAAAFWSPVTTGTCFFCTFQAPVS